MTIKYLPKYECQDRDCVAILESLRRLLEGTWELQDEDLEYAWDLLPRVRMALENHIQTEARELFGLLTDRERQQHNLEHLCLKEQLNTVHDALVERDGVRFHTALATLLILLDSHHRDYDARVAELEKTGCECVLGKVWSPNPPRM